MLAKDLPALIHESMKKGDKFRVSTLKLLASELYNARIAKGGELSSEEELEVVKKEAKKRRDAMETYTKVGKMDKAQTESDELNILKDFLPEELSDEEIENFVNEALAEAGNSMSQMGQIMALSMQKVAGRADGSRVAKIVKQKLS